MSLTEIICTPEYRSEVPGIDISAVADIQPDTVPDETIAHQEYIGVYVIADGSNQHYPHIHNDTVAIFFTQPHIGLIHGRHDGVLYTGLPSDLPISELILVDQPFDTDIPGANLEVWSPLSEEPLITLSIAPLEKQRCN